MDLAHGSVEGHQVDFAQRPFAHLGTDAEALELFVVTDVMLDRGTHPFPLQTGDVGYSQAGGQEGVFGETFKIAPTQWRALDVDCWGQEHLGTLHFGFPRQRLGNAFNQVGIPR